MPDSEQMPDLRRLLCDASEARHRLRRLTAAVAIAEEAIADILDGGLHSHVNPTETPLDAVTVSRSRKLAVECRQLLMALDDLDGSGDGRRAAGAC